MKASPSRSACQSRPFEGVYLRGLPVGGMTDEMFIPLLPGTTWAVLIFGPGKVIMNDGGC
jgi:hypothetical protein